LIRIDGKGWGGSGTDTIRHRVFRQTRVIVRAASGTVFGKLTNASTPVVIYKHQRVEKVNINRSAAVRIVMQAGVAFDVFPSGYSDTVVDIAVPGGVWTAGDHVVTAANLGPVTWSDTGVTPTKVTIHAL
jgi:hypothetical protein